ncbi:MAG: hypothetical protein JWR52_2717 [Marmoricola sp.]|nr:hypothetical protein [Marmoricola sp.]
MSTQAARLRTPLGSRGTCQSSPMVDARKPSKALGWLSLSLLVLAALAVVVPVTRFAVASGDKGVALGEGPSKVQAPGGRTWGIYFNDPDNSGYSESCNATDSKGQAITLRDPGMTVTSSDTEMLDHVFTTPADGRFTIECDAQRASARVGPVGRFPEVAIGLALAALLGLGGLVAGSIWLTRRSSTVAAAVV